MTRKTPPSTVRHPDLDDNNTNSRILDVLESIRNSRQSGGVTAWKDFGATEAQWRDFPDSIDSKLKSALIKRGVNRLWRHQTDALDAANKGENTVIVTPTASGKTLCYNLPVLNRILLSPGTCALYLYPTKALAQDQYHNLGALAAEMDSNIHIGIYDGDTPSHTRKGIRENATIVLTNPDMLHTGILPHHSRWSRFIQRLSFIIIDELHQYRGVFGSHLCNVMRRLKRICRFHGSNPQFIMSSATIANPEELASRMTGEPVCLLNQSGAPSGEKTILFYNPPVIDSDEMIRRSYLDESLRFTRMLVNAGIQTIVFTRSRRNVELLLAELQKTYAGKMTNNAISGYRGGYLPRERREIENGLRNGTVRCVVATSALELGIDIGDLGASVLAGYPGTIASTWQRAGRAGRRENRSLAVMVASAAPLDQYIVRNPEYFFSHSTEHALINPDNLLVLLEHIRCAAFELPFSDDEKYAENHETAEFLSYLMEEGDLSRSGEKWFYTGGDYPAQNVSLRSVSPDKINIVNTADGKNETIGELDVFAAHLLLHPEAVYMHGGRQYLVDSLNLEHGYAHIQPLDSAYYTLPLEQTRVSVLDEKSCKKGAIPVCFGDVQVTGRVMGYRKLRYRTQELLGTGKVNLPERELVTNGTWVTLPVDIADYDETGNIQMIAASLVGVLTAIHSVATVVLMSDPRDLGAHVSSAGNEWTAQTDHLGMIQLSGQPAGINGNANLFIYDCYPGGIGLSETLFRKIDTVIVRAKDLVIGCDCRYGCPGCIGPVVFGEHPVKTAAANILRYLEQHIHG
jgi:DEAD/DEAH box helicase domain-containing protein